MFISFTKKPGTWSQFRFVAIKLLSNEHYKLKFKKSQPSSTYSYKNFEIEFVLSSKTFHNHLHYVTTEKLDHIQILLYLQIPDFTNKILCILIL